MEIESKLLISMKEIIHYLVVGCNFYMIYGLVYKYFIICFYININFANYPIYKIKFQ